MKGPEVDPEDLVPCVLVLAVGLAMGVGFGLASSCSLWPCANCISAVKHEDPKCFIQPESCAWADEGEGEGEGE